VRFKICRISFPILLLDLLLGSSVCSGGTPEPQKQESAAQPSGDASSDVRAMGESIRALYAQLEALMTQINDMKNEQQKALQEARNLRHELEALKAHPHRRNARSPHPRRMQPLLPQSKLLRLNRLSSKDWRDSRKTSSSSMKKSACRSRAK